MATLQEMLLTPDVKPKVLNDCETLIEQELSEKSGVSGNAVKLAHKVVTSLAPGYYRKMLTDLVPQMVTKLEPFWADSGATGGSGFGDYLAKRGEEVAEALLSVTDEAAESSERPAVLKAYRSVRGNAGKHVEAALPRLGDMILKYTA